MAHSRADIESMRAEFFASTDKSIVAIQNMIDKLQSLLAAIHNARRAVIMIMGEEAPLDLGHVKTSIKDIASKIAGNGQ